MYFFISDEPSIAIQFQFSLFHSNRQRDMRYLYIYTILTNVDMSQVQYKL